MIILVSLYNFVFFYIENNQLSQTEVRANSWYNFFTSAGFQFLIAGAASMLGAFLGFIFGIPKYVPVSDPNAKKTGAIAFSDNLVQVSDWLTKIIVGVGLTQLTNIPHYLNKIGTHVQAHSAVQANVAIAILVYFIICGFAAGYLWTTIYYPPIMNQVHKAVSGDLDEIVMESEVYQEAMRLINEQLSKGVGQPDVTQSMLEDAIGKLNDKSKDALFQFVDRICYENANSNNRVVERIIPVFQAFIKAGNPEQMFDYLAELGFAYMAVEDYKAAYTTLLKARDLKPAGRQDYEQIEHNLAESLIKNNTNPNKTYSISEDMKQTILTYLKAAIKNPRIEKHMNEDSPDNYVIRNWLKSINMNLESLKS